MKSKQIIFLRTLLVCIIILSFIGENKPATAGWTEMESGTTEHLKDIWSSSGNNSFAVGTGGILHYDGHTWSKMESGATNYRAIWGTSASDVFAVGYAIYHYDGSTWSQMNDGKPGWTRYDIWGSSANDVFVVGDDGFILRYDGSTWSEMDSGTTKHLTGVWGSSGTDVFVVGHGEHNIIESIILHYDGSTWSEMGSETSNDYVLFDVWGNAGTDVFTVGFSPNPNRGIILHYDGSSWSKMDIGTIGYQTNFISIWGSSRTDIFATGVDFYMTSNIVHYDGSTWSEMDSWVEVYLSNVWGSSGTDVFAVGSGGTILHYDGQLSPTTTTTTDESSTTISQIPSTTTSPILSTTTMPPIDGTTSTTTTVGPNTTTIPDGETTTTTSVCPTEEIYGEYSEQTELLRHFRDNVLSQSPAGQEIIRLYYQWSPAIVQALEGDEEFNEQVKEMIDGVLDGLGSDQAN